MDYPVYGRPWIAFSQQFLQKDVDTDSTSVCSSSPPPSPLSPTPSSACNNGTQDYEQFDFSTMSLCKEVPALFGLNSAQPRSSLSKINDGFYKRLILWLNNKKRTTRRRAAEEQCKAMQIHEQEKKITEDLICTQVTQQEIMNEWTIPWKDVRFGSTISKSRSCTITTGRWHGDVIIHEFRLNSARETNSFWSEVHSLSKLRHENLLLFMGVAINYPAHSVVNSAPRGVSLTKLRQELRNGHTDRIGLRAAVTISRQVAQAMGYLHARGLFHGKLNTDNIFLEGENYKVKLSLLDHGLVPVSQQWSSSYVCVPKSFLGYLSPEHIRSIVLRPPEFHMTAARTKFMDSYAFGSLLFDLLTGCPPFWSEHVHSALWRLGMGVTPNLDNAGCSATFKALIQSCWSYDPWKRPDFVEIVERLQPSSTLLCKAHSSSEPERLNRIGACRLAC